MPPNAPQPGAWEPEWVAERWKPLAVQIFESADKLEQKLRCQILLVGVSNKIDPEVAANPRAVLMPHACIVRFSSPKNNRDKNFTRAKMERRLGQIEESVAHYLRQLDSADRQEASQARATKIARLKEKIAKLKEEMQRLSGLKARMLATADQQISLTDPDSSVDGDERPRVRCRRLQCSGRCGHRTPSDHHT